MLPASFPKRSFWMPFRVSAFQRRAVMSGNGEGKQAVFLLRAAADVVDDQRRALLRLFVGNDADVG